MRKVLKTVPLSKSQKPASVELKLSRQLLRQFVPIKVCNNPLKHMFGTLDNIKINYLKHFSIVEKWYVTTGTNLRQMLVFVF